MKPNLQLGKIYDTLRFFEIYFNYDEVVQDINNKKFDVEECLKSYNNIIKYNVEISPQINAFFSLNGNVKSFLTDFFIDNIGNISTINDLMRFFDNEELILMGIVEYYFNEIIDINTISSKNNIKNICIKKLYDLELDDNLKIGISLVICDYNYIIEILKNTISIIYTYIEKLFKKNNKLISEFKIERQYLKKLEEITRVETFNNAIYCISLLRNYNIQWVGTGENNFILFLGSKYKKALETQHEFMHVTYDSIANVLSNKIKIKIIETIYKYKKINAAEIIKLLPPEHSDATIYRLLNNLLKEKVVYISERDSKHVYYSLNFNYFENTRIVLDEFLLYYIKGK